MSEMGSAQRAKLVELLKDASELFKFCSRRTKVLSTLSWGKDVAREFFAKNASVMPQPKYVVDRKGIDEAMEALVAFAPRVQGESPVHQWLARIHDSFVLGTRLIQSLETPAFYEISTKIYGNPQSRFFLGETTQLQLAQEISGRLSVCSLYDIEEKFVEKSAEEFVEMLEDKLRRRKPNMAVKVEVSDEIVAKVIAGMNRVRVRKDARFSAMDLKSLWNHEVESHCLTAHNGARQAICGFLASGGPRTTRTQEGLAVFYEMYGHTMGQSRFIALCHRVEAVDLVANGANFIDLYRWYCDRHESEMEAFYSAQRVFRGTQLTGKYPFTKDVVYLSGLLEVYHFLQLAAKTQNRLAIESLICGRLALEDIGTIAWLRSHGIVDPPHYVPDWLKNWDGLMSFFSFSSVLGQIDMSRFETYAAKKDWDSVV